jgi:D-sedoheptulose 7-phosphate isomerase
MIETIRRGVAESLEVKRAFFEASAERIAALANEISLAFERGNKVLLFGNGGSAADAQHLAAEWVGRFCDERRPFPAIALTTDTSILTCIANDYGYERIFERQVHALGVARDIAIGISTSGNSRNVLLGIEAARDAGLITAALTGCDGGKLGPLVRYHLNVPHRSTARVQEVHIMIGHLICELVDETLKGP